MKIKQLIVFSAFIAAAAVATAGENPYFNKLDADGNGVLSQEEAAADPVLMENWATADINQDGQLEQAEFSAFEMKAAESAK
jgi:hypothetical protein